MNTVKAFLVAALLAVACVANAGDWPRYFDAVTKNSYILVILHEDGRAQYFNRFARVDAHGRDTADVYLLHDDAATWGRHPGEPGKGPNGSDSIWVRTRQFRFDYYLEPNRLLENEKSGIKRILMRRTNTNPESK